MRILFSAERIAGRIGAMGSEISTFYRGKPRSVIALMNGGICFAADLMRATAPPLCGDRLSSPLHLSGKSGISQNPVSAKREFCFPKICADGAHGAPLSAFCTPKPMEEIK